MLRRLFVLLLLFGVTIAIVYVPRQGISFAAELPLQTRITRTPVPTATSPGSNPPPPTAVPTNPPAATQTPTNTPIPVTLVATPAGGFLPTAAACGVPPTIQTRNNTLVRTGPGTGYDTMGGLVYLEVRPIVGRAAEAPWWLIQLANGQAGWVANEVVLVQGYTGDVPIVAAPAINGQTPTPGALWQPTAVPGCPTSTATTTAPSATAAPPTATQTAALPPTATTAVNNAYPAQTATSVVPSGAAEVASQNASAADAAPEATAAPLDDNAESAPPALPCASAALGVAAAAFFVSRRFW